MHDTHRCFHPDLLREPHAWLHQEPASAPRERGGHCRCPGIQRPLRDERLGQGQQRAQQRDCELYPPRTFQSLHLLISHQLFLSDPDAKFSKSIGWADNASGRTGRYAMIIDHGKVSYAQIETEKGAVKVRKGNVRTNIYEGG